MTSISQLFENIKRETAEEIGLSFDGKINSTASKSCGASLGKSSLILGSRPCHERSSIFSCYRRENPDTRPALGDSDDENEEDCIGLDNSAVSAEQDVTARLDAHRSSRRLCSAIMSHDSKIRLEGLNSLLLSIEHLIPNESQVPPLDYLPPYDPCRIALTHRSTGAIVSDMDTRAWEQWDRTHTSVMSQFYPTPTEGKYHEKCKNIAKSQYHQQLQTLFDGCGSALFRCFGNKIEKCRSMTILSIISFSLAGIDTSKHRALLFPAIFARYPPVSFDSDMNVFVHNSEEHERHRRGGAIVRQDREGILSTATRAVSVVEPSEEIRLLLCDLLESLVRAGSARNEINSLDPYFADIVLALYSNLRDPYPELIVRSSLLLVQMMRIPQWEVGAKHFALGIARGVTSSLRHRKAKVRLAALELFEASVCVPNREKIRGAGTDAIVDLIGFREENVLPVAAFYDAQSGVSVNILAELTSDKNIKVRLKCCEMLAYLLTCLPDRQEHTTRLLPYLLSFHMDPVESICQKAEEAVGKVGEHYEAEHPEEIVERRQYGVDGDEARLNRSPISFPSLFSRRPRLGARLFVRNNTKRFLSTVLNELESWQSKTRKQSAELLLILVAYCEEHITMGLNTTLPMIIRGMQLAQSDYDGKQTEAVLLEVLHLIGRHLDPTLYIPIVLHPILADVRLPTSFTESGRMTTRARSIRATALAKLLEGFYF